MCKLLTVAIAAYNSEAYLSKCLESLLIPSALQLTDIIVVNDGSKDKTLEIAKRYESKYPDCIQVINKENGNYGSCMNVALAKARGIYFRTLDSDDTFDRLGYERFLVELTKTHADMIISNRIDHYVETARHEKVDFSNDIPLNMDVEWSASFFDDETIVTKFSVQNLTFKTQKIRESGLKWSEGVFFTDNEYVYWSSKMVTTVRFINDSVYVYEIGREGQSIGMPLRKRFPSDWVVANKILDDMISSKGNENHASYPFQKRLFIRNLAHPIYHLSFLNDIELSKKLLQFDRKVSLLPDLYKEIGKVEKFGRVFFYVDFYRNSPLRFFFAKIAFRLYFYRKSFIVF